MGCWILDVVCCWMGGLRNEQWSRVGGWLVTQASRTAGGYQGDGSRQVTTLDLGREKGTAAAQ